MSSEYSPFLDISSVDIFRCTKDADYCLHFVYFFAYNLSSVKRRCTKFVSTKSTLLISRNVNCRTCFVLIKYASSVHVYTAQTYSGPRLSTVSQDSTS